MAKIFIEPGNRIILSVRHDPYQIIHIDKNGYALMLSSKVLDSRPYNKAEEFCTWERSSLREYLNGTFLKENFTEKEREKMISRMSKNDNDGDIMDHVFALSKDEFLRYRKYIFNPDFNDGRNWWLRSRPAPGSPHFDVVNGKGEIGEVCLAESYQGVRPAFWLDLNALGFDNILINRFYHISANNNAECVAATITEPKPFYHDFWYDNDGEVEYWDD